MKKSPPLTTGGVAAPTSIPPFPDDLPTEPIGRAIAMMRHVANYGAIGDEEPERQALAAMVDAAAYLTEKLVSIPERMEAIAASLDKIASAVSSFDGKGTLDIKVQ